MSTTLTLKQTVASVWQKFMKIVGHKSIKEIGDGTLTGAIAELNSNITLKTLGGISCTVSYNNAIVLIGISVNDLNMGSNTTTNKIVLPSNVTPISGDVFITTDV